MTSLPILTYHRIVEGAPTRQIDPQRISVSQAQFRSHLSWLKRLGYRSFSLSDYPELLRKGKSLSPRSVAITFDDGYEEVLRLGLPVLQEVGFTATVFAVPGQLGGCNAWDDGRARLLSADELRQLDRAGITIGAHTCQHAHLTRINPIVAEQEIRGSKTALEEIVGHAITLFAYPYGETEDWVDGLVQAAGFEAAFATDHAPLRHADNLYRIRRAVVFPRNTAWEIILKSQRWYSRYQEWKRS